MEVEEAEDLVVVLEEVAPGEAEEALMATKIQEDLNLEETLVDLNLEETLVDPNLEETLVDINLEETLVDPNLEETLVDSNLEETLVDPKEDDDIEINENLSCQLFFFLCPDVCLSPASPKSLSLIVAT